MLSRFWRMLFRFMLWSAALVLELIGIFGRFKKKRKLPPMNNVIYYKSATQLAKMIRQREVKSVDVVNAFITRCNDVNPILNAIVETRYDQALEEANRVDELLKSGNQSVEELEASFPLLGVPLTIKESIAVAGMSHNVGRFKTNSEKAMKDADDVVNLKAAGGIPILVSNTPELCMCTETFNYVTGQTRNPYDVRRTPGGSSGGEAVLISSGASVIGLGADIAGSLRIPAMYCGIFSHKPTAKTTSAEGHIPFATSKEYLDMLSSGPMCRYAEDLRLMMKVLYDPKGPALKLDVEVPLTDINFYYIDKNNDGITAKLKPDVNNAMQKVIDHFGKDLNIKVKEAEIKNLKHIFEVSVASLLNMKGLETRFSKPDDPDSFYSMWPETIKLIFGCSKSIFSNFGLCWMKMIGSMFSDEHYENVFKMKDIIKQEFMELLKDNGVLIFPTLPYTAPFHNTYYGKIQDVAYMSIFNVIGFPATSCPVGLTPSGLPVGLQIIAKPGNDHLLFTVAKEFERAFGGWIPPPSL